MMNKYLMTIGLLILSNAFMTFAWYGHLKFFGKENGHSATPLWTIILISWGLAFFEYCFQVPANRIGSSETGGPFSLVQLKIIQEVITLIVFVIFSLTFFKGTSLNTNHLIGFALLVGAVYFIFKA
ncbi:DMT family protein [Dyadobacter sediminis]|nr:DMT family protein [Dyadobacter sediminis]GGB95519.1 membrane protein [Dyadobacter sediminis]